MQQQQQQRQQQQQQQQQQRMPNSLSAGMQLLQKPRR